MIYNFEKLEVWQMSMDLVDKVYKLSKKYPVEEKYGLTAQLRKSVTSISLNIAEGSIKRSKKEFVQSIRIALGSLVETITNLKIGIQQSFITQKDYDKLSLMDAIFFKLIKLEKTLLK